MNINPSLGQLWSPHNAILLWIKSHLQFSLSGLSSPVVYSKGGHKNRKTSAHYYKVNVSNWHIPSQVDHLDKSCCDSMRLEASGIANAIKSYHPSRNFFRPDRRLIARALHCAINGCRLRAQHQKSNVRKPKNPTVSFSINSDSATSVRPNIFRVMSSA